MKCVHDAEVLSRYLEQDLPAGEMADVVAHLAECPACRGELKRLRTAMVIMQSAEQVAAPRDYAAAVKMKLKDDDART